MNALELFRTGMDTVQIADHLGIGECDVEAEIHRLRNIERSKCVPAQVYVKPSYPKPFQRIGYAGKCSVKREEWDR